MSEEGQTNGNVAAPTDTSTVPQVTDLKGKGKSTDAEVASVPVVDDDEDESEEDQEDAGADEEDAEDDNMEEIDEDNIIGDGRRTRGKAIDFAKAAEGLEDEDEDEDEEDDDFEDPDESMQD